MSTSPRKTRNCLTLGLGIVSACVVGAIGGMYGGFFGKGVGDSLPEYFLVFLGAIFFIFLGPWVHIRLPRRFLPPAIANMLTLIVIAGCLSVFLGIVVEKLTGMVALAAIVGAIMGALSQIYAKSLTATAGKLVTNHPRLLARTLVVFVIVFIVMFIWTAIAFAR